MTEHFFSPCPRGLETFLVDELKALGADNVADVPGGVSFSGDWALCWRANLESRIATRVLWKAGEDWYRSEDDVYQLAHRLPWERWFSKDMKLRIYVTASRSPLKSLNFVTLRIKDGVCDRFREERGTRPSIDTRQPDVRIHAFLTADRATLYLDTSGEALTRRGFKRAKVEAPLKENLAAGILKLSGWEPGQTLLDPMCGSGTFALEAAMMALDIAPGIGRNFGFEKLTSFDARQWNRIRTMAEQRRRRTPELNIYASDIDPQQVANARANLAAAGLEELVHFDEGDFVTLEAPAAEGVIVTNPPYGVRLGDEEELQAWYPQVGDHLKRAFAGWRAYLFTGDPALPKRIGLKASRRTPLMNGDIECRLLEYRIVAGSNRDRQ
ncbi:THUMP domain-containing class I SAM-dependent RNA methyltransferase [Niveibacterium terrae]|uniref:THUMP domain-containing class I SAM-dependent RNA methyltransferase n=1 Tax=Niveibacterium terrae TaxID=3373598 RepID=UPI003A92B13B